jgi:hypothetical protein
VTQPRRGEEKERIRQGEGTLFQWKHVRTIMKRKNMGLKPACVEEKYVSGWLRN